MKLAGRKGKPWWAACNERDEIVGIFPFKGPARDFVEIGKNAGVVGARMKPVYVTVHDWKGPS